MCLPGCELSNSPIIVDPLLHDVINKVFTDSEEDVLISSLTGWGAENFDLSPKIKNNPYKNSPKVRLALLSTCLDMFTIQKSKIWSKSL